MGNADEGVGRAPHPRGPGEAGRRRAAGGAPPNARTGRAGPDWRPALDFVPIRITDARIPPGRRMRPGRPPFPPMEPPPPMRIEGSAPRAPAEDLSIGVKPAEAPERMQPAVRGPVERARR